MNKIVNTVRVINAIALVVGLYIHGMENTEFPNITISKKEVHYSVIEDYESGVEYLAGIQTGELITCIAMSAQTGGVKPYGFLYGGGYGEFPYADPNPHIVVQLTALLLKRFFSKNVEY